MPPREPTGPDLAGVAADASAAGLDFVVIGAFAVIYHGYVRATKDTELLVAVGPEADAAVLRFLDRVEAGRLSDGGPLAPEDVADVENLRVGSRHGIIDIMRGQPPPLDYSTVARHAETVEFRGQSTHIASLRSLLALKRLARRPQDQIDLTELEAIHGEQPGESIPALDT